jgi:flagellar basal body-associated protein FliL
MFLLQSEYDPNHFCISQKSFAIGIAIAGLILMAAVVVAILILVSKRRRKNLSTTGEEESTALLSPCLENLFLLI